MKNILLLILVLAGYACNSQTKTDEFIIKGTVNYDVSQGMIYLKKIDFFQKNDEIFLDSCIVDKNGKFTLKIHEADEATVYFVGFKYGNRHIILKDSNEITLTLTNDYKKRITSNSPTTNLLYKIALEYREHGKESDSLYFTLNDAVPWEDKNYVEEVSIFKEYLKTDFLLQLKKTTHPGLAIYLLDCLVNELDTKEMKEATGITVADKDYMKKAAMLLSKRFPDNNQVQIFAKQMNDKIEKLKQ